MTNFWKNILRYPRFFISSLSGSIIIILNPFKKAFKTPKLRTFISFSVLIFIIILLLIIKNMTAI